MIVKVQVALGGFGAGRLLLIYNEARDFRLECESPDVLAMMKGRTRAFFHAEIVSTDDGHKIAIDREAKNQDW